MTAVLMLDLKDSKKYSNQERNRIQQYLVQITDNLNDVFREKLLRNLSFKGGDELQGLFCNPESAFLCLRLFWRALHTIKCHAGIGIGEWTTVVEGRDTYYQDGPVYHRARRAIEYAKKETDYAAIVLSDTDHDPVINAMINSCYRLTCGNSAYQNELAILLECRYPISGGSSLDLKALEAFPEAVKKKDIKNMEARSRTQKTAEQADEEKKAAQTSPLWRLNGPIRAAAETNHSSDSVIFQHSHPYGAASELAEYTGLTRQAVDHALRKADIYTERAIAMAIVSELRRIRFELQSGNGGMFN